MGAWALPTMKAAGLEGYEERHRRDGWRERESIYHESLVRCGHSKAYVSTAGCPVPDTDM